MGIYEHTTEFAGRPVVDWDPETGIQDPTGTIYRVTLDWEEAQVGSRWQTRVAEWISRWWRRDGEATPKTAPTWADKFALFLEEPSSREIPGLVVGAWHSEFGRDPGSEEVVQALVAARERLPNLKALFFGDITSEECEISWIQQTDLSPLFAAYPDLEQFCVRGTDGLRLGQLRLPRLRSLVIQSGGLPREIVQEIGAAELPELEHLELWLGEENYGGTTTVADLAPILSGERFPNLRSLGLRDSEIADEIAAAVATAPILERIRVLDLSLGTLGDDGAEALLASPAVARLERLDIHHHYCSEAMVARLNSLGIPVDASEPQEADEDDGYRYVAVGE